MIFSGKSLKIAIDLSIMFDASQHSSQPTSTPGIAPKIMEERKTLAGWCKYMNAYQILINYEVY